nr:RHS repeat-associated core domain-containing protein [uncultured Capnocytophaga sp.]
MYYDFETKLAYNRFRYYSPETGAYISQDPIRLTGGNPTLYGYVGDNNTWIDVWGLDENMLFIKLMNWMRKENEQIKFTQVEQVVMMICLWIRY